MARFFQFAPFLLVPALSLAAACSMEGTADNMAHLDVTASPASLYCPRNSPELQVYGTPPHATRYVVDLRDVSENAKLGSGEVAVNPSGIIPAGTVESNYSGSCPVEHGHSYRYDVQAVDTSGRVVGVGAYTVTL